MLRFFVFIENQTAVRAGFISGITVFSIFFILAEIYRRHTTYVGSMAL
ncbi:MAG: hypothetical protein MUO54_12960 [Anaerolineales bacterium]|nr:hypothetical protein [Anaerolineales bacterium]